MTTGKDVLDQTDTFTLPISEGTFWLAVFVIGVVILNLLIIVILPDEKTPRAEGPWTKVQEILGLSIWPQSLVIFSFGLWLMLLLTLLGGVFWIIAMTALQHLGGVDANNGADLRWSLLTITALTAALSATVALPFTLLRSNFTRRQTVATEQGLITDRINAAVASLGAQKERKIEALDAEGNPARGTHGEPIILEETLPNMEVRIGAIYALERIARENLDFHVQIMEILCAYIRENSPAESAVALRMPEMPPEEVDDPSGAWARWAGGYEDESGAWHYGLTQALTDLKSRIRPRTDIQTALEVLGRRTKAQREREAGWPDPNKDGAFVFDAEFPASPAYPDTYTAETHKDWVDRFDAFQSEAQNMHRSYAAFRGYRLDLRATNLQFYDLQRLHLNGARFEGAQMQGANLGGAQMMGATLWGAQMMGADLGDAQMMGANLGRAQMMGADLGRAQMMGADLRGAQMMGVNLGGARMMGADLGRAQMMGANLRRAQMMGADLGLAQMMGADLGGAQMMGADLWGAQMMGADLRDAQMSEDTSLAAATLRGAAAREVDDITLAQLRPFWPDIFADGTVSVPSEDRPAHWPAFEMEYDQFETEWRKWQADPEGYTPPNPPED